MRSLRAGVVVALILAASCQAQILRGSLVVFIVSKQADYVVIGAESRNVGSQEVFIDDRAYKVISLGGDTLFYESANSVIGVRRGKSWSSEGTARAVYASSPKKDALSLSATWGAAAMHWFYPQPEQDLRTAAYGPRGSLVTGGFINFDKNGNLSVHSTEVSFNAAKRTLNLQPSSQAPGQVGAAGVALDLVEEFFAGRTDRAVRAFGPVVGTVRSIAVDPTQDVSLVRKTINFVMDNARAEDRATWGGPIDVAIIRKNGTIRWISRKCWCSQQDQKPTHSPNRK